MHSLGMFGAKGGGGGGGNAWDTEVASHSPELWMRLDDTGSTAVDSSGNGHDGTFVGTVTKGQSPIFANLGNCLYLTDGYVTIPHASSLSVTGAMTMIVAFKRDGAVATFGKLFWKSVYPTFGEVNWGLHYNNSSNTVTFRVTIDDVNYNVTSTTTFSDATSYIAIGRVEPSTNEITIWIGAGGSITKEATTSLPGGFSLQISPSEPVLIGGGSSSLDDWHGNVDECILIKSALSDADIAALYAARA